MLLGVDGFDLYGSANDAIAHGGWSMNTSGVWIGGGRSGPRGMHISAGSGWGYRNFPAFAGDTMIVGLAINFGAFGSGTRSIARLAHPTAGSSFEIGVTPAGQLAVGWASSVLGTYASGLNLLWTATDSEPTGAWNFYEYRVLFSNTTAGAFAVRKNGAELVSQSGVKTCAGATPTGFAFTPYYSGPAQAGFDDLYICDGNGPLNNDFLGDVTVCACRAASDIAAEWTRNTGASNAEAVGDDTPDGDTSYVAAASPMTDTYAVAALPEGTGQVLALLPRMVARKTDSGSAAGRTRLAAAGGGDLLVGRQWGMGLSYVGYTDVLDTDPADPGFAPEAVNALRFSIERVS